MVVTVTLKILYKDPYYHLLKFSLLDQSSI
jgi:hypothetical protein